MTTLREIAKDYLHQAVNLQCHVIKPEDLFSEVSINVILTYQGVHNKEVDKDRLSAIILEEYEALLHSPQIERYFTFHNLLKKEEGLKHFAEVEKFASEVSDEKVLYHMLEKAIDKEDLKTVMLLVPRLDIGYVHMLKAMKNLYVFQYLYSYYTKCPQNLLSLACYLQAYPIQEFLLSLGVEPREIDRDNQKYDYIISYLKAKEIASALLSRMDVIQKSL